MKRLLFAGNVALMFLLVRLLVLNFGVGGFGGGVVAAAGLQKSIETPSVRVEDPSGRPVFASTRVQVARSEVLLGVRALTPREVGAFEVRAEVVALDAAGELLSSRTHLKNGEVALEWRRYEWAVSQGRNDWRYRTTVRAEQLAVQPLALRRGRQTVRFAGAPERQGGTVVARCAGQVCEQTLGVRPARPDRLRVRGPAAPVVPGTTATIQVDSPADGRGFVTLEGDRNHGTHVVAIAKGHNAIEVPIPAGVFHPNLHAVVTLTRPMAQPRSPGTRTEDNDPGPFWLVGGASIGLSHASRGTAVDLTGPAEVRPESQVVFALKAPGAQAATVALVDEGVLNLTRHTDPDPLAFFLARRRLDSRGADIGGFLMNRVRFLPGVQTGGDGGSGLSASVLAGSVNSRIRPVALFCADVQLDAHGRGEARFELPPYEGRLRVMVVASGARVVGAAARSLVVKAPLGVQVAMPRMLMPGDRVVVPVTIENHTGAAGTVVLELAARSGPRCATEAAQPVEIE